MAPRRRTESRGPPGEASADGDPGPREEREKKGGGVGGERVGLGRAGGRSGRRGRVEGRATAPADGAPRGEEERGGSRPSGSAAAVKQVVHLSGPEGSNAERPPRPRSGEANGEDDRGGKTYGSDSGWQREFRAPGDLPGAVAQPPKWASPVGLRHDLPAEIGLPGPEEAVRRAGLGTGT